MPVGVVQTRGGTDIGPLLNAAAAQYGLPTRVLVAIAIAESNLSETAERHGGPGDKSFGLFQQTAVYASVGDRTESPSNLALCRAYYFDPAHAIADAATGLGAYYRQTGSFEETAARWNGGPSATWATIPTGNQANYAAAWEQAGQYEQEAPMPAPTSHPYSADTPSVLQTDAWSCSVASTAWALRALGIDTPYPGLEGTFIAEGLASPSDGLLSASGQPLAAWLRQTYGLTVEVNSDADWAWIAERAGQGPILLGGRHWGGEGHWSGCRGLSDDGGLSLANPSPGWGAVWTTLYPGMFGSRGGWTAIYIQAADEEDPTVIAELQQQVKDATNLLDNIQGDWTDAAMSAVQGAKQTGLKAADRNALLDAALAALATIQRGGPPTEPDA